ncbi:HAD family hydrolase [Nocardia amamiensis]|uniref:HAD family hydrolase n=1 Tax=Nocardia amamiensis TaxID=404578 RepID=UPI000A057597|nr:HAD family hydrolase [Nocardia amamiensis]
MSAEYAGLIVWDVDGTLIPADLRWLRRAVARTYAIQEADVTFPAARVHGYTDESIVVDTAITSGISPELAERGIERFPEQLAQVMADGEQELARDQPPYPGAAEAIDSLAEHGFVQTVLTGNLRSAAEFKLRVARLEPFQKGGCSRLQVQALVGQPGQSRRVAGHHGDRMVTVAGAPLPHEQLRRARAGREIHT